jgi:hypothetical protein
MSERYAHQMRNKRKKLNNIPFLKARVSNTVCRIVTTAVNANKYGFVSTSIR